MIGIKQKGYELGYSWEVLREKQTFTVNLIDEKLIVDGYKWAATFMLQKDHGLGIWESQKVERIRENRGSK